MAKHDVKGDKLQINRINSKETAKIVSESNISYNGEKTLDDYDLVYKKYVDTLFSNFMGGANFLGQFDTLEDLEAVSPDDIPEGSFAYVGTGDDFAAYYWDNNAQQWGTDQPSFTNFSADRFFKGNRSAIAANEVLYTKGKKDIVYDQSGNLIIAPDFMGNFVFTRSPVNLRGVESALIEGGQEFTIENRTGAPITVENGFSGPANSSFNIGSTLTIPNGGKAAFNSEDGEWVLGVVNEVAFSDTLNSVNAVRSIGPDGLEIISGIYDNNTATSISIKQVTIWIDGTPISDDKVDGFVYFKDNGKYYAESGFLDDGSVKINRFGCKGNGTTDDTEALNLAIALANILQAPLVGGGRYLVKNTVNLIKISHADLDLVVADDFEDEYVVSFANAPSRSRSYTIRIDGRNVAGVTGIELQDPTIGQLYVKAILYRLERGIHVFRNAEKLKLDIFAYQCGKVVEENATLVGEVYSTPDENDFSITGSGNETLYHCSSGIPSTTLFFNAEGNFSTSEKAVIIDSVNPEHPTSGKLITLAGSIRGFQCAIYIDNPGACVDFNNLYLNDGGRVDRYTELEANALLPAIKVVTARTLTGRINLKPTYVNTLQIDQLTSGGDLSILITNFRANCVQIGNDGLIGSVIGLNLNIHASDSLAIFDNYLLKICSNVQDSFINLLSTGKRKVIIDSNKISLTIPSGFFIGTPGVIEGTVTKLPIEIKGDMTHGQMSLYPYKIKGMRAFNSTLQRWMYWNGLEWVSDSFSIISGSSVIVENPAGGILDLSGSVGATGALVLRFPEIPLSGSQGLYEIDLDILDYGTPSVNKTMSFKITGLHGLSTAPSWTRTHASSNDFNGRDLPVKFGFDSEGYPVIVIGDETSVWSYPNFQIKKVKRTRRVVSAYISTFMDQQWSLSVQSDLSAISILTTITNAYFWGDYNKLINKPSSTPDSSTTVKGLIETATPAEDIAGSSAVLATTPAGMQAKFDSIILKASPTFDFPTIAAGERAIVTATLTGAAIGDIVQVTAPVAVYSANDSTVFAYVSAPNTVSVVVRNNGLSSVDYDSGVFTIRIIK